MLSTPGALPALRSMLRASPWNNADNPRGAIVGAAACVFAVTACVAAGVLAYGIAMYAPMGYPAAWDGILWW